MVCLPPGICVTPLTVPPVSLVCFRYRKKEGREPRVLPVVKYRSVALHAKSDVTFMKSTARTVLSNKEGRSVV